MVKKSKLKQIKSNMLFEMYKLKFYYFFQSNYYTEEISKGINQIIKKLQTHPKYVKNNETLFVYGFAYIFKVKYQKIKTNNHITI